MSETDTSKKCPKCRLINPSSALVCDCGYNFDSGAIEAASHVRDSMSHSMSWSTFGLSFLGLIVAAAIWRALVPKKAGGLLPPDQVTELFGYFVYALSSTLVTMVFVVTAWVVGRWAKGPLPTIAEGKAVIIKWTAILMGLNIVYRTVLAFVAK